MSAPAEPDRFHRVGSHVVPDFVNTVFSPDHEDGTLRSARDIVDFLVAIGHLKTPDASTLRRELADLRAAERFLASALQLREAARSALEAIEGHKSLDASALAFLNSILRADAGYERLDQKRSTYVLTYERLKQDPSHALAPLALETARLLAASNPPIRKCSGVDCVRHFYDDSRTKRRRWCEMAICGNRAKATAFAERRRDRL